MKIFGKNIWFEVQKDPELLTTGISNEQMTIILLFIDYDFIAYEKVCKDLNHFK